MSRPRRPAALLLALIATIWLAGLAAGAEAGAAPCGTAAAQAPPPESVHPCGEPMASPPAAPASERPAPCGSLASLPCCDQPYLADAAKAPLDLGRLAALPAPFAVAAAASALVSEPCDAAAPARKPARPLAPLPLRL